MKIAAHQADAALKNLKPETKAVLFYGPDAGLVSERAKYTINAILANPQDPFALMELELERIKDDPALLHDEITAMTFFSGRRVIRVRSGSNLLTEAIANAFSGEASSQNAFLIVTAEELTPASSLRQWFEKQPDALAVPCYKDESETIRAVITSWLHERHITVEPDVTSYLQNVLGGDRLLIKGALEKLALYAASPHSEGRIVITLDMARDAVGDVMDSSLEALCAAVASRNAPQAQRHLDKVWTQGIQPIVVLRALNRYFLRVHYVLGLTAKGESLERALQQLRPPVFFKEIPTFRTHLQRWNSVSTVAKVLTLLYHTELSCKATGADAELFTSHCVMRLAG